MNTQTVHQKLVESTWTRYEDVANVTTEEYFQGNKFSIDVFRKKYSLEKDDGKYEEYPEAVWRVCQHIASVEKTEEDREYWARRWFHEIYNDWWHPAGSIMQGAGCNKNISLANCTTCSLGKLDDDEEWDNLESIYKNGMYTVAKCAAYRQGLGIDVSRLRPRSAAVHNSSKISQGAVHWMQAIDRIGDFVGQLGRRPALLLSLDIRHPDIEEFITIKSDYTKIQNANISAQLSDDFYKQVLDDGDWELRFDISEIKKGQKIYVDIHSIDADCKQDDKGKWYKIAKRYRESESICKTVKARYLLELIAKNMCKNAEPGIQNIDIARKYSNSDYIYDVNNKYDSRIISSNACSEQYLSRESLCVLSSINAEKFSITPYNYEEELETIGYSINRFLDNVNECELVYDTYATPHQKLAIESLRRTGAGMTNMAGWLFKKNLAYGTPEGNSAMSHFNERYNYYLYKSSIELGKEKGSFGLFNREKFEQSPFVKHMMDLGLEFEAMRNVTCSSIAPTGSLSTQFRETVMSYGVEPAFGLYFWKRTRISGFYEYYFCVPHAVRQWFADKGMPLPMNSDTLKDTWEGKFGKPIAQFIDDNKEKVGIHFRGSLEITPLEKLDLMARLMKDCDSSISVTYMLPEGTDWKDIYTFIVEAYKRELKSIAAFPDRKMYGIVSFIPFKDLATTLIKEGVNIHNQNFTDDELQQLKINRNEIVTNTQNPPKRPEVLDADVYTTKVDGEHYILAIGKLNGYPYEMFGGKVPEGLSISQKSTHGVIRKVKRGKYQLEVDDKIFESFSSDFQPVEQMLFRMISLMMRHGIPLKFIVEQLDKGAEADKDNILSLKAATRRILKKYIKDGEKVSGSSCPNCKSHDLIYKDGCVSCASCDWSKCS